MMLADVVMFSAGIVLAATSVSIAASDHCPPNCDCKTPTSSTKACDTSAVCADVEYSVGGNGMRYCDPARHREGDFPSDCKDNVTYSTDPETGETVANWGSTNCNQPSEHCSVPCECQYNDMTGKCEEIQNTYNGTWSNQTKPTNASCSGPY